MLPKIKYLLLALFGSFIFVSPAFAATPAATDSNRVKVRDQVQVRTCQARQQVIRTRMENLLRLSSTMMDVFSNIENRVDVYYQTKVAAKGGSVANYNELIQDINDKKGAVDDALETAKLDSMKFSCESDNPKEALTNFRTDMQEVKSALKDYRTSIRNFLVAVKTASKTVPTTEPTGMMEK